MLKLTALALFAAFFGAEAAAAQTMTLTSPDIAPGANDRRRAGLQCLWLHRRQHLARAVLVGSAEGHEELRAFGLRSRRADGQRFLALGRLQHPAGRDQPAKNAGNPKRRRRAEGRGAEPHRLWRSRLRRPLPPKGDAPHHYHFTIFAVDTPKLDGDENISARRRRVSASLPHARQGGADRRVGALISRPNLAARATQFT